MKHAVISDYNDGYMFETDGFKHLEYAMSIQRMHMLMERVDADVLWTMPGCYFSQNAKREHFEALEGQHYSVYVPEHLVKNRVYGARVTFKLKGNYGEPAKDRFFMFPENREWKVPYGKDKGVWDVGTPEDLLQTVRILEAEYGYCLWGPSYMGLHYFKDILRRQDKMVTGLSDQQSTAYDKISRGMVHPLAYANLHTKGKYLHWLDKNGWYLGGAQSVKLGNGAFVPASNYGPNQAAFFRYGYVDTGSVLPNPLGKEGWAHVDLLEAARHMGIGFETYEGIRWEESSKYLNTWAIDMWKKRDHFILEALSHPIEQAHIYANCASTAKMVPNTMMGRLRNEGLPHWNDAIIHRSMANQAYTLQRLYREEGIVPVMVSKDALFFSSDEPDVHKALPSMLAYEHAQRGYKHVGTCVLTEEIEHAFSRVNEKRFGVNGIEQVIRKEMN